MNNKVIIRAYNLACESLKTDKSEENMQKYLIIFSELDSLLDKQYDKQMEEFSLVCGTLNEEIFRVTKIINLIQNRKKMHNKMLNDHKRYIGYEKIDMTSKEYVKELNDYISYKQGLMEGLNLIKDTSKSVINKNTKDALYHYCLKAPKSKESILISKILLKINYQKEGE